MLTARETLIMYSAFRGIPLAVQDSTIEKVIDLVGLNEHADYVCGHYSGGNKRKLCLGIAILGFPELVILDEPTAGMDPESRKRVWRVLTELKSHQCSVMLTSHSMDEAENVSDRITIMTSGKLRCIGSPSYIKQKFGDDFELQLKLENPNQFDIYDLSSSVQSVDKSVPLDKDGVGSVLKELDCVRYFSLINQRRSGSAIFWTLEKKKRIPLEDLLAWLIIERTGDLVMDFLRENFEEVKVEEHYLTFFKIKIVNDEDTSLGGIFHLIEINKKKLKIAGYSLSQTTLDQIFNRFANNLGASGVYGSSATFQSKFSFGMTRLSDKT
jgi:ABC-type multidrug transport system ATPase subunit